MFGMTFRLALGVAFALCVSVASGGQDKPSYESARWDPRHFKPLIEKTPDTECLQCHAEVLAASTRAQSPAGVRADLSLAWYQTLDTYSGAQDTMHRRHLSSDYARQVMDLRCNTCHQGHDPREEAPGSSATSQTKGYTLRKQVDPKTCLMCHGQFNWQVMGLPGPWKEHGESFGNNCMSCHAAFRTTRHNVNFLKPQAIEAAGAENGDVCYGCHGGRAWYRNVYPYPRHAWEGMDKEVPDWAKDRPTQSEPRFMPAAQQETKVPASSSIQPAKPRAGAQGMAKKPASKRAPSGKKPTHRPLSREVTTQREKLESAG